MLSPLALLAVGCGAALGAWVRWFFSMWLNDPARSLAVGTLVANLIGGLLIGIAMAVFSRYPDLSPLWRLSLVTGFLGALTTFSAFSAESLQLLQRGEFAVAAGHILLHVVGCLLAVGLGYKVAGG
ncbi:MAG: fluoride efflux transporter CrcB [Burkholderiaceae bacterium]